MECDYSGNQKGDGGVQPVVAACRQDDATNQGNGTCRDRVGHRVEQHGPHVQVSTLIVIIIVVTTEDDRSDQHDHSRDSADHQYWKAVHFAGPVDEPSSG